MTAVSPLAIPPICPYIPSLSPRSPFLFRKRRPPRISITHSTSYNKANRTPSFQGWTTEPSRRKKVPQAGNGVKTLPTPANRSPTRTSLEPQLIRRGGS